MSTKKHNVRPIVSIEFADGVTREVSPLTLKQLRKFVVALEKIQNSADMLQMSDEDIDNMIDAASIILSKADPELAADREAIEEAVDLTTFQHLMSVAMGSSSPEE